MYTMMITLERKNLLIREKTLTQLYRAYIKRDEKEHQNIKPLQKEANVDTAR